MLSTHTDHTSPHNLEGTPSPSLEGPNPSGGLTGDLGNVIEVGVVMQHRGAVVLCSCCGEETDHAGRPVLARLRQQLYRPCAVADFLASVEGR